MSIPYRTQRAFKRLVSGILVLTLLVAAGSACWFIWAQRYIIYTADGGARLNFDLPPITPGKPATPPEKMDVTIRYDLPEPVVPVTTELKQMIGYYVEPGALKDLDGVKAQIQALPADTPVMIDVKDAFDGFYYSSHVRTSRSRSVDVEKMDALIAWLKNQKVYTIAKLPALKFGAAIMGDFTAPGTNQIPDSVLHSSGGYSYSSREEGLTYYWLNPSREGTVSYLSQVIVELRNLGFDEVVLEDFCLPADQESIQLDGDRTEMLSKTASLLVTTCATDSFALSFVKTEAFTNPEGRSRIYLTGLDATQAEAAAALSGIADTAVNLVFLTELHDTRFDVYSVLRPLSGAH